MGVYAQSAAAADTTSTVTTTATADTASASDSADTDADASTKTFDPTKGGHVGASGTKEVLLTGDTAAKVTAAALAAIPGATIERVENDADGATYEAHMTKSDGTHVTVTFDANYAVVETQTGGHGGHR